MLAGTAEVFTVTVPAWLLAALAFLGTVLGGAISFAVNQLLIKLSLIHISEPTRH